jgi:hypothetical protein
MESKKGIADLIFVVIMMVIISAVFLQIVVNVVEATPEQGALKDSKKLVEDVCNSDGPSEKMDAIFLPVGYRIFMNEDGTIELQNSKTVTKVLSCPSNIQFSKCTIGYTKEGAESVTFAVDKTSLPDNKYLIKLNDTFETGIVNCE